MQRIKNIEFLRVVCTLLIVTFHIFHYRFWGKYIIIGGDSIYNWVCQYQKAVDFFFIISGFFLVLTFKPTLSLLTFIKKRVIRLWPLVLFILICYALGSIFHLSSFAPIKDILTLLFINNIGLPVAHGDSGNLWFLSALLWGSALYFLLIKHTNKKVFAIVAVILSSIAYAILLSKQGGEIRGYHKNYFNILNIGLLRAVAGLGLGSLVAIFWQKYKDFFEVRLNSMWSNLIIGGIELLMLLFIVFNYPILNSVSCKFIYIIMFMVLFIGFVFNKGFLAKLTDKDIWTKLSKYSFSVYVVHIWILYLFKNGIFKPHVTFVVNHIMLMTITLYLAIILFGVLTYHFVEEPCAKYLKNKWLK